VRNEHHEQSWLTTRPQHLKYGDKTHLLQTNPEAYRHELYQSSGPGNEHYDEDDADADDSGWGFSALISHTLAVQKAEETTAGVDSALEQLKSSMAAMKEIKEANK
jgi:RNA polymerase II elongation factor ELL